MGDIATQSRDFRGSFYRLGVMEREANFNACMPIWSVNPESGGGWRRQVKDRCDLLSLA
jgi:hypothetical protein